MTEVWNITTAPEVFAALKRNPQSEVYLCADGTWNILHFGRLHEIAEGLVEKMVAEGRLARRWPDSDACYVLAGN